MKRLLALFAIAAALTLAGCSARGNLSEIYDLESGTPYPVSVGQGADTPGTFVITGSRTADTLHVVFVTPERDGRHDRLYNPAPTSSFEVNRSLVADITTRLPGQHSTVTFFVSDDRSFSDSIRRIMSKHLEKVALSLSMTERQQLGL